MILGYIRISSDKQFMNNQKYTLLEWFQRNIESLILAIQQVFLNEKVMLQVSKFYNKQKNMVYTLEPPRQDFNI